MNRAITLDLIPKVYTTDTMGQRVETDGTKRTVYATLSSISRQEWVSYSQSGRQGLVPAYVATVFFGPGIVDLHFGRDRSSDLARMIPRAQRFG